MLFSVIAAAQNRTEEKVMVDSLVYRQASAVDSALVGKSIFNLLIIHCIPLKPEFLKLLSQFFNP